MNETTLLVILAVLLYAVIGIRWVGIAERKLNLVNPFVISLLPPFLLAVIEIMEVILWPVSMPLTNLFLRKH